MSVYKTKKQAKEMLEQQPLTLAYRARHIIVPVYKRDLLGDKLSDTPIGYGYRLRAANE